VLQTRFCDADKRADILRMLGQVAASEVRTSLDDGITQQVEARAGVAMKAEVSIINPVRLTAFRTFRDIPQPSVDYVLRAKDGNGLPNFALFEADGGAWKLTTIARVRDWLVENLPGAVAVLA
jgi:hypothetical protein